MTDLEQLAAEVKALREAQTELVQTVGALIEVVDASLAAAASVEDPDPIHAGFARYRAQGREL